MINYNVRGARDADRRQLDAKESSWQSRIRRWTCLWALRLWPINGLDTSNDELNMGGKDNYVAKRTLHRLMMVWFHPVSNSTVEPSRPARETIRTADRSGQTQMLARHVFGTWELGFRPVCGLIGLRATLCVTDGRPVDLLNGIGLGTTIGAINTRDVDAIGRMTITCTGFF